MSLLNFDASRVAPSTGELEPMPAGWYDVVMDASEMKPTKDAATTGNAYLECRFNVASGQYTGRKLFARLNLRNSNPVAAEIAQKELSAICHAVNVLQVQDSQQLHGIPMKVKVKLRPADGQYAANNEITTFKPANFVPDGPVAGAVPAGAQPPAMGMPPAAPQQPWAAPGTAQPPQQWQQPPAQAAQPPAQQQPWQQGAPAAQQAPQWQAPAGMPQQTPQQQPAAMPPTPPQQPQPWAAGPGGAPVTPPWQQQPPQG